MAFRATAYSQGAPRPLDRVVRPCGAPDRDECLLGCVLRAATVAEATEREPEHRARVASVELVERAAIAAGDSNDQLAVGRLEVSPRGA